MANEKGLTHRELQNLAEGLNRLMIELETNKDAIISFYENPMQFLNRFGITILDYIKQSRSVRDRFIIAIRETIGGLRRIVNECLGCKIAVLLIMGAILGNSGLLWHTILEGIDLIKVALKNYFERTGGEIDRIFRNIEYRIDRIRPSHLALIICESLGFCPAKMNLVSW